MNWLIVASICLVALAFVALVIYLILTLLSLRRMVRDLDDKVHSLDPIFRVVAKAGSAIEKKATHMRQLSEEIEDSTSYECSRRRDRPVNTAMEVAEWALIGMALWQKIKERRMK
jgi:uncharacterized protein YoxC